MSSRVKSGAVYNSASVMSRRWTREQEAGMHQSLDVSIEFRSSQVVAWLSERGTSWSLVVLLVTDDRALARATALAKGALVFTAWNDMDVYPAMALSDHNAV